MFNVQSYYRFQAPIYDVTRKLFLFKRDNFLRKLSELPGKKILDIGCGTGYSFEILLSFRMEILGLDVSMDMLKIAKNKYSDLVTTPSLQLVVGDCENGLPVRGKMDKIMFSYSLSMMNNYKTTLDNAYQTLEPGGIIGIVDFLDSRFKPIKKWLQWNGVHFYPQAPSYLDKNFDRVLYLEHDFYLWYVYEYFGKKKG